MVRLVVVFAMIALFMGIGFMNGTCRAAVKTADMQKNESAGEASDLSGKVLESMDSGGYTYVLIEKDGKQTWVASPKVSVNVGDEVTFAPGMAMKNFKSKTLNRTFEVIVFSGGVVGQGKESASGPSAAKSGTAAPANKIEVDKALGPGAYTVSELYGKSTELDSTSITVRGKVVKVSPSIMGKNWIHLQDGSGTASNGTNDLLVTSEDLPEVGDIVTARGTLYKDKDFGSGYKYSVIVEQASIKK